MECNGSPVYVASTFHEELAGSNTRVTAGVLRRLVNDHVECDETYMENRTACFVTISD
jgi:hypothetical protein